jgi:hypothetical protein
MNAYDDPMGLEMQYEFQRYLRPECRQQAGLSGRLRLGWARNGHQYDVVLTWTAITKPAL